MIDGGHRLGFLVFVYRGFYCNIYMTAGNWEFEVFSGDDLILWGNNLPVGEIGVGYVIEAIIGKLDGLNSINYA